MIFFCTNCGAKLSAESDEIGEVFDCPRCGSEQVVPGAMSPADSTPIQVKPTADPDSSSQKPRRSTRILKVPKKRQLVMSAVPSENIDPTHYLSRSMASPGIRIFSMFLGLGGAVLAGVALLWAIVEPSNAQRDWWVLVLMFMATLFLCFLGLALSQLAFRIERLITLLIRRSE